MNNSLLTIVVLMFGLEEIAVILKSSSGSYTFNSILTELSSSNSISEIDSIIGASFTELTLTIMIPSFDEPKLLFGFVII